MAAAAVMSPPRDAPIDAVRHDASYPLTTTKSNASSAHSTTCTCPSCGTTFSPVDGPLASEDGDSQRRIQELEQQVRILTTKAAAAVDKLADYEDEIRQIRRQSQMQNGSSSSDTSPTQRSSNSASNRISNFLSSRRAAFSPPIPSTPNLSSFPTQTPTADTFPHARSPSSSSGPPPEPDNRGPDLRQALTNERKLRESAEEQVRALSHEIEDLSVSLFTQANEMVASERKARAKLEERVALLEKRDVEKRRRLEQLEQAMKRAERVRSVLSEKNI